MNSSTLSSSTTSSEGVCFNNVINNSGVLYWKDGCKGSVPTASKVCTQVLIELTENERADYYNWVSKGSIINPKCI